MGRSSRDKGAKAELEVRDLIRPWLQRVHPEVTVVRTPGSGGWMAGRDKFGARGDLMVKGCRFPWCVEVKRREAGNLDRFFAGKLSPIWGWWNVCCDDAAAAGLAPMMWYRRSHTEWLVLLPRLALARACPQAPLPSHSWGGLVPAQVEPVAYWARQFLLPSPGVWMGVPGAWGDRLPARGPKKELQPRPS